MLISPAVLAEDHICPASLPSPGRPQLQQFYEGLEQLLPGIKYSESANKITTDPADLCIGEALHDAVEGYLAQPTIETQATAIRVVTTIRSAFTAQSPEYSGSPEYQQMINVLDAILRAISNAKPAH
jgi:hypothetical protein